MQKTLLYCQHQHYPLGFQKLNLDNNLAGNLVMCIPCMEHLDTSHIHLNTMLLHTEYLDRSLIDSKLRIGKPISLGKSESTTGRIHNLA